MYVLMCVQPRLISASASVQSIQSFHYQHVEVLHSQVPIMCLVKILIRPQGYKTFFMLNSAEHEIFSANKYEIWHFHIY